MGCSSTCMRALLPRFTWAVTRRSIVVRVQQRCGIKYDAYSLLSSGSGEVNEDTLKHRYLKLAKEVHPDINPGDNEAQAKFVLLAKAYEDMPSGVKGGFGQHVGRVQKR